MNLLDGYTILVNNNFWESVEKNIPKKYLNLIKTKLNFFKENPYYPSLNTKSYSCNSKIKEHLKNQGVDEVYEFYINRRKYRCIFYVLHSTREIIVVYAGTHDQLRNRYAKGR